MKMRFGKVIMSLDEYGRQKEMAYLDGLKSGLKVTEPLIAKNCKCDEDTGNTEDRKCTMQRCGFFPVTDEFWRSVDMTRAVGYGFNWAIPTPKSSQPFMPFHERHFDGLTAEQIEVEARKAKKRIQ